jgi:hypothetical protein
LTCFILGNEPEKMAKDYPAYREAYDKLLAAITASTNAPEARFCGPSTTHKNAAWAGEFARDSWDQKHVVLVTQHEYPARSGLGVTNAAAVAAGCNRLLSPDLLKVYQSFHDEFVPAAISNGLPYRLEEANSFSNGGARGVSDAFASALWGLDYLYWWADHRADGINFHTGGYVPGTRPRAPMNYAVFWNSADGFAAHPLAYALKAFDSAGPGRLLPADLTLNPDRLNLRAYGVLAGREDFRVVLINKEYGPKGRAAEVILNLGKPCRRGQVMFLMAPGGDVLAKTGVTLGGAPIAADGTWNGAWTPLAAPPEYGQFKLTLPAATAAIIKLKI